VTLVYIGPLYLGVLCIYKGAIYIYRAPIYRVQIYSGVPGSRIGESYVRFLKNVDVTDEDMKQQVLSLADIFKKQNVRVTVEPKAEEGSAVARFLEEDLSEVASFHFSS